MGLQEMHENFNRAFTLEDSKAISYCLDKWMKEHQRFSPSKSIPKMKTLYS